MDREGDVTLSVSLFLLCTLLMTQFMGVVVLALWHHRVTSMIESTISIPVWIEPVALLVHSWIKQPNRNVAIHLIVSEEQVVQKALKLLIVIEQRCNIIESIQSRYYYTGETQQAIPKHPV